MLRKKIFLRSVAMFLAIQIFITSIHPSLVLALTSGPSAPEFSTFEPVDTTDMINVATGDLVYNHLLFDLPGPEGGYPISLSYHAGIRNDQEASWVGLGFTLNPGAISRSVSGFPDDVSEAKRQVNGYWGGGNSVTKTYNVGITVMGFSANYSQARTTDTYKGFSVNNSYAASVAGFSTDFKGNYSYNMSIDPVGIVLNRVLPNGGASSLITRQLSAHTSMGISIGSRGLKVTQSELEGGAGGVNLSSNVSMISSSRDRGAMMIGAGAIFSANFSMKDYYTRYWSDETQAFKSFGALYQGEANQKIEGDYYNGDYSSEFVSYGADIYDLPLDASKETFNSELSVEDDINDPSRQHGGTFPAYDHYMVMGQGIGGVIRPYCFENGDLFAQNVYDRGITGEPVLSMPILEHKSLRTMSRKKLQFRFLNDFSNHLSITPPTFENGVTALKAQDVQADEYGFNKENLKLAGSRHVEWFSNSEIEQGIAKNVGFIDYYENRHDRKQSFELYDNYLQPEMSLPYSGISYGKGEGSYKGDKYQEYDPYVNVPDPRFKSLKPKVVDISKRIGGFMITNETGVTYHYALPVYNYNEYTRTKLVNPYKDAITFKEYKNDEPFAYTWLLTAITGPDFVDFNNNGVIDDQDWGYWVKFDYGRWADSYQWRTPLTGYMPDIDKDYETFSYGVKELYYLDAIETRSHKAIFIKSKRKDARGVTSRLEGGCNPRNYKTHYKDSQYPPLSGSLNFYVSPVSTLKLDAIYLFKKEALVKLPFDKATGKKYNEATSLNPHRYYYQGTDYQYEDRTTWPSKTIKLKQDEDHVAVKYHNGYLVYDDDDISGIEKDLKAAALKVVQFNTDYSLARGVSNSIGYVNDNPSMVCTDASSPECVNSEEALAGNFEWPNSFGGDGCVDRYRRGKIICCEDQDKFYSYRSIFKYYEQIDGSCPEASTGGNTYFRGAQIRYNTVGKLTLKGVKVFGKGGADLIPETKFGYAKNQHYESHKYDEWGFYKSDAGVEALTTRRVSGTSAASADMYSLSSIVHPLGSRIEVEYEPKEYKTSVYNEDLMLDIEKVSGTTTVNHVEITFREKNLPLSDWFLNGKSIAINALVFYDVVNNFSEEFFRTSMKEILEPNGDDVVIATGSNTVQVYSPTLYRAFTKNAHRITNKRGNTRTYNCTPIFISGFAKVEGSSLARKFLGGPRVRSLSTISQWLGTSKSVFEYTNPTTGASSGVTSYTPYKIPSISFPKDNEFLRRVQEDKLKAKIVAEHQKEFLMVIYKNLGLAPIYAREAPPPGAIYEYVTKRSFFNGIEADTYTQFRFKVFKSDMVHREIKEVPTSDKVKKYYVDIHNYSSDVGDLISTRTYSLQNKLIAALDNGYLHDEVVEDFEQELLQKKQGVIEQSYHKGFVVNEFKVRYEKNNWAEVHFQGKNRLDTYIDHLYEQEKHVISRKKERTNILTSITEVNYNTGIKTKSINTQFDFYSGKVIRALTQDSYGNTILTVSKPAYSIYPALGLKVHSTTNKNMLTQDAQTIAYKVNASNGSPNAIISSSVQTWSNNIKTLGLSVPIKDTWRKDASYIWQSNSELNSDGTFSLNEYNSNPFNFESPHLSPSSWQKVNQITLYNKYSVALEGFDVNEAYSTSLTDHSNSKILATCNFARHGEVAYSGSEYFVGNTYLDGGVSRGEGSPSRAHPHSGDYSLAVAPGKEGFNYSFKPPANSGRNYKASVWFYAPGYAETQEDLNKINIYYKVNGKVMGTGHATVNKNKAKSFYLLNLDIVPDGVNEISIGVVNNSGRAIYFDDFRVHPINSSMTSYVYDSSDDNLTYILDNNNFYIHYEYDAMGRLIRTTKERLNFDFGEGKESSRVDVILNEMIYNFKRAN